MTKEHAAAFKRVMEKRRIIWCDYAAAFQVRSDASTPLFTRFTNPDVDVVTIDFVQSIFQRVLSDTPYGFLMYPTHRKAASSTLTRPGAALHDSHTKLRREQANGFRARK